MAAFTATAILATGPRVIGADDQLLAEVRAAWDKTRQAAKTVKITWTAKNTYPKGSIPGKDPQNDDGKLRPPTDFTGEDRITLLLDGTKCRFTATQMNWTEPTFQFEKHEYDSAFGDGKFTGLLQSNARRFPQGEISKARGNTDCDISAWPFLAVFRGTDPQPPPGTDLSLFTSARRTVLAGRPLIELLRERTPVRGEAKLWVDPAQHFAPYRFDKYVRDGALEVRTTVTNRKDPSGLWVPASWSVVAYRQSKLIRSIDVTVQELVLNPPTKPEDFEIKFPPGTWVGDDSGSQGREFLVREDESQREILPQERGVVRYKDLLRTDPGELDPGSWQGYWSRNRVWLIAVGVSLIVGGVVVFFRRRAYRAPVPAGGTPGHPPSQEKPQ